MSLNDDDFDPTFLLPSQHECVSSESEIDELESSDNGDENFTLRPMEPSISEHVSVNNIETAGTLSSAKIIWYKQTFISHNFVEKSSLIKPVGTPMEYLKKYLPDELFDLAALCTNQYYIIW